MRRAVRRTNTMNWNTIKSTIAACGEKDIDIVNIMVDIPLHEALNTASPIFYRSKTFEPAIIMLCTIQKHVALGEVMYKAGEKQVEAIPMYMCEVCENFVYDVQIKHCVRCKSYVCCSCPCPNDPRIGEEQTAEKA